jgi:hypothetical protein
MTKTDLKSFKELNEEKEIQKKKRADEQKKYPAVFATIHHRLYSPEDINGMNQKLKDCK